MKNIYYLILAIAIFIGSCNNPTKVDDTQPIEDNESLVKVLAPDFNADSAYYFTKKQVDFGPRIPGTEAQNKCATYLTDILKGYCKNVIVQNAAVEIYNGKKVPMKNIIASFNPENPKRILLFAHWDTRPYADQDAKNLNAKFDGADDGAASSAILLEIARCISLKKITVGVDIALFDVEDYGPPKNDSKYNEKEDMYALGTQYWCKNPHVPNYKAYYGILLDMCAAKNAQLRIEGSSNAFAPSVIKNVWNTAAGLGYGNIFLTDIANSIIDDHTYVNRINGTPSIDLIWLDPTTKNGFAPHWHTLNDNINVIDKVTMKAVGQTLLQVIYNEPSQY